MGLRKIFRTRVRVRRELKNFTSLQVKRLVCSSFRYSGGKHKIPALKTKGYKSLVAILITSVSVCPGSKLQFTQDNSMRAR